MNTDLQRELWQQLDSLRGESTTTQLDQLRRWLASERTRIGPDEVSGVVQLLTRFTGRSTSEFFDPPVVVDFVRELLKGHQAKSALDPAAGFGGLVSAAQFATGAERVVGLDINQNAVEVAQALNETIDWHVGNSIKLLDSIEEQFDVVIASLPFGVRPSERIAIPTSDGQKLGVAGELAFQLLVLASLKLTPNGTGIFVVSSNFFWSQRSPFRDLNRLGLGVGAAFALPAGAYAPYTSISAYIVVVRKSPTDQMFVAQLQRELEQNSAIIRRLRLGEESEHLDDGKYVDAWEFRGLQQWHVRERFGEIENSTRTKGFYLIEIMMDSQRGRPEEDFEFQERENAIYLPTVGISDVVCSTTDLRMKRQNYLQVVIDTKKSDAQFVASFLNTELGRAIREASKSGNAIGHLTNESLKSLRVLLPPLPVQKRVLEVDDSLEVEENLILGLQNEISDLRRQLWREPLASSDVNQRLETFSSRLSAALKEESSVGILQWMESLPFPMASILRAWHATPSVQAHDRYEYLIDFFEATAQFMSVVLLSAFTSDVTLYERYRVGFIDSLIRKENSFQRPDFGTWRNVYGFFAKRVATLLNSGSDSRQLCARLFSDPTNQLPTMFANKSISTVFEEANKVRNDWKGHAGRPTRSEAQQLHDRLEALLNSLRSSMGNGWENVELVLSTQCRNRHGVSSNTVFVLTGSNNTFLSKEVKLRECLDTDDLHLVGGDAENALRLLPFIKLGEEPPDVRSACYFYNRVDGSRYRLVSYAFSTQSEIFEEPSGVAQAIERVTRGASPEQAP